MITSVINENGILRDAVRELGEKNCTMPDIERVIYNIGTKAYPKLDPETGKRIKENGKLVMTEPVKVLTTVVFFIDGTKVTVTNSEKDGVKFLEDKAIAKDPESPTVLVADETSKEIGLVYALAKRLLGKVDWETGKVEGNGFGRKLRDIVANAYDTGKEDAKNKYLQKVAKATYEASKGTAKPKRPSFAETVIDFKDAVDSLKEMIEVLKADIAAAKA